MANEPGITVEEGGNQEHAWLAAARHDPWALDRLLDNYLPRVYSYVRYRVSNRQDSEDLVAETFLRAVQAIKGGHLRGRQERSFAAWIFRVAHNLVSDYYRRRGREEEPVALDDISDLQARGLALEQDILQKEESAYLHRLVVTLSPRRQEIITLKFFGGLRNVDLAAILGLDERTVASHLCLAIEDLHRKFQEKSEKPGGPGNERPGRGEEQ